MRYYVFQFTKTEFGDFQTKKVDVPAEVVTTVWYAILYTTSFESTRIVREYNAKGINVVSYPFKERDIAEEFVREAYEIAKIRNMTPQRLDYLKRLTDKERHTRDAISCIKKDISKLKNEIKWSMERDGYVSSDVLYARKLLKIKRQQLYILKLSLPMNVVWSEEEHAEGIEYSTYCPMCGAEVDAESSSEFYCNCGQHLVEWH